MVIPDEVLALAIFCAIGEEAQRAREHDCVLGDWRDSWEGDEWRDPWD